MAKWFNPNRVKDLNQISGRKDIKTELWMFHFVHHTYGNYSNILNFNMERVWGL